MLLLCAPANTGEAIPAEIPPRSSTLAAGSRSAGVPIHWLVWAAALASGCATLIYELSWIRLLTLVIGATYPAIAVVLAGMMLGLGIGSVAGGRVADRPVHPLRAYLGVELAVLIFAGGFPLVEVVVGSLDLPSYGVVSGRALVAGLMMLPATTLMGMTFPLLSAALHRNGSDALHVPMLYGFNTIGATLGTIAGGLVLPFVIGVPFTLGIAALGNATAALLAWQASKSPLPRAERAEAVPASPATDAFDGRGGLMLALAFGSGALVMLAELYWTRSLMQINREAFDGMAVESADMVALVMVLVLFGNGLGGIVTDRFGHWGPDRIARLLSRTWLVGGVISLLMIEWFGLYLGGSGLGGARWDWTNLVLRMAPAAVPSVLLGISFPLLARLYSGALAGHGKRMGRVWMLNTFGSVIGSVFGGWVLLPWLGTSWGLVLCAAIAVLLAGIAMRLSDRAGEWWPTIGATAAILAVVLVVPKGPGQGFIRDQGARIVGSWEGWESTTIVGERSDGSRFIASNGRMVDARTDYERGGRSAAHELGPDLSHVMLVGFGTGLYAAGLLDSGAVGELVVVEIDGGQLRAAPFFGSEGLLSDPRVTIEVNDALHYLAETHRRFDLIVVDAWGPEASPAIYSKQFHERAMARLTPGGRTWAKLSAIVTLDAPSTLRVEDAVRCTYPYAALTGRAPNGNPTGILGANEPLKILMFATPLDTTVGGCRPLDLLHPHRLRITRSTRSERLPAPYRSDNR